MPEQFTSLTLARRKIDPWIPSVVKIESHSLSLPPGGTMSFSPLRSTKSRLSFSLDRQGVHPEIGARRPFEWSISHTVSRCASEYHTHSLSNRSQSIHIDMSSKYIKRTPIDFFRPDFLARCEKGYFLFSLSGLPCEWSLVQVLKVPFYFMSSETGHPFNGYSLRPTANNFS